MRRAHFETMVESSLIDDFLSLHSHLQLAGDLILCREILKISTFIKIFFEIVFAVFNSRFHIARCQVS